MTLVLLLFVVKREAMLLPRHIVAYGFSPFFLRTTTSMKSQSSSIESVPLPSSSSASTSALRSAVSETCE